MTTIYGIEHYNTRWDYPEWELSTELLFFATREGAEKEIEKRREEMLTSLRKDYEIRQQRAREHNAKIDALEAAGLDPKVYMTGFLKSRIALLGPYQEPEDLTDEMIGYRIVELDIVD